MTQQEKDILQEALSKEMGIELSGHFSEAEIIDKLALQIAAIAEKGQDAFFQLMYRLDIREQHLVKAMFDKEVAMKIAILVYNRQLQKIRSRAYYKKNDKPTDEDLTW